MSEEQEMIELKKNDMIKLKWVGEEIRDKDWFKIKNIRKRKDGYKIFVQRVSHSKPSDKSVKKTRFDFLELS